VTVFDEKGSYDQDSITLYILSGAGVPTVAILSPDDGSSYGPGSQITFTGFGTDPEDGSLQGDSLDWYSNIDGYLGSGEQITTTLSGSGPCAYQPHVITLIGTDSDNHQVSDQIDVIILIIC
jgi:hypothetical protein